MRSLDELRQEDLSELAYVLTDIDDTITRDGKLEPCAYDALWALADSGLKVIPVTGRPAGWCDLIIRQWPVDAVVGENGAFVYYREAGKIKTFVHPSAASPEIRKKLDGVRDTVLAEIPGTRPARDQFARIYDLAIDFNEDPPYLGFAAAEKIKELCESLGARAKVSSIHVNTWFGDYDKLSMTELFLGSLRGEADLKKRVFFFGDSPNDEPMFASFPLSCGVANIRQFLPQMEHLPSFVTGLPFGDGFAQGVERILQLRASI